MTPTACGSTDEGDAGPRAGTGGQSIGGETSGGAASIAGAAPIDAGAGGSSGNAGNCTTNSVGTCCTVEKCMPIEQAWAMADVGASGAAGASGAGGEPNLANSCPRSDDMPTGLCYGYSSSSLRGDECCFGYWTGDCCGRPFIVGGRARDAGSATREDWLAEPMDRVANLDERTREALARAWLTDALMEHASVASFSRFVLHLLALGAPAKLVERAQAAIGDEVRHARSCFSLASRYSGRPLGPGRLELTGSLGACELSDAAAAAVIEGCVGETLAALEAGARLAGATDGSVCATLQVIQRDEAVHAELAWTFVKWCLEQGGSRVRSAVTQAFEQARAHVLTQRAAPLEAMDLDAFRAHGHMTPAERVIRQQVAFKEVIEPCWRALLDDGRRSRSQEAPGLAPA